MKKMYIIALLACMAGGKAAAQTPAEQKAWMAYMTPGKEHARLSAESGTWSNDMTFWHDPKSPPMKATTNSEVKMLFDGRYQEIYYKGEVMGMPFEGKSTIAFDNATKEYISTWIDNMGTGLMVMHGKADKSGAIVFKGEMVNPVDGKANPCREVYTVLNDNTRKLEMFDTKDGKEWKSMEIIMKKNK
jgi:Protein of unknown function (DUF1579)